MRAGTGRGGGDEVGRVSGVCSIRVVSVVDNTK